MSEGPEPTDDALCAAWLAGDERAFERLFARWQTPLARHLERMLDDAAAAEDLVVEAFFRLHRSRDRVRRDVPLKPFVWTIARNLARNRLRMQRLWGWLPLASAERDGMAPRAPAAASDLVQTRVAAAFAALPAAQREACSLRVLGELSLEEIATVTGTSVGTVKSRLFYGLRRLRELLADLDPSAD
jgi:RNA polymerase sigma-70 factor (ECF subfamily)